MDRELYILLKESHPRLIGQEYEGGRPSFWKELELVELKLGRELEIALCWGPICFHRVTSVEADTYAMKNGGKSK